MGKNVIQMKPKILIIENSIDVTGALNSILRSSFYLKDSFDFSFVLPSGSKGRRKVEENGFDVYELPFREVKKNLVSLILYFPFLFYNVIGLRKILRKRQINLIINNDFYNLLPPLYNFLTGQVPYVCYVRFLPSKFPRRLVEFWSWIHKRWASSIIAVSVAVEKGLPSSDKVVVVPNELPLFEMPVTISDSRVILYPSNYIKGKGQEYALDSFALISKKFPDWILRFVGSDMGLKKNADFKVALIEKARKLGIDKQVIWEGYSEEMQKHYSEAPIVLIFSESESFSLTCLEAMFSRCAVIATRCGGPEEIIEHSKDGILVPIGGVQLMANEMEKLMLSKETREQLSVNAQKSVCQRFSLKNTVLKLVPVYNRAMGLSFSEV